MFYTYTSYGGRNSRPHGRAARLRGNPPHEPATPEQMIRVKEFMKITSRRALKSIGFPSKIIWLLGLPLLTLLPGCGSLETVKGDVIKVDKRSLPPDVTSFQLILQGPGVATLKRSEMCPIEERRIWREVEVSKQSAAISVPQGIGCGALKFVELGDRIFSRPGNAPSNCGGQSTTDRRPTGRQITGPWQTVRREPCGKTGPVEPGGVVRITFIRTRSSREYPVEAGGAVRFGREELARLRIFLSILKDMEIEARYGGASWLQKLNLE